jgi:hypothetical protein
LAHSFRGFNPWSAISIALYLSLGKTPWWWEHMEEKAFHFMAPRKQKDREKLGIRYSPQIHAPSTYFLNLGSRS